MEDRIQILDKDKIFSAVKLHTPIVITTYTLPHDMEVYMHDVLREFLLACNQSFLFEYLNFCLSELLINSKKANTKRVYFLEKNLDINNELEYHEGMLSFKEDTLKNIDYYLEKQKALGLYIKLSLQVTDDKLIIEIRNNSVLTEFEEKRIREKIRTAQKYNDVEEVISKVLDQTEGAGLGIIIIILMLQKVGLDKDTYEVYSTNTETITRVILPFDKLIQEELEELTDDFIEEQNEIPLAKDSFQQLLALLKEDRDNLPEIFECIMKDVTLSLILMQAADKKDKSLSMLSEAFKLFTKEDLIELYNPNQEKYRLVEKTRESNYFWNHGYRVALYAYNLANNFLKDKINLEEAYLCGLFHDIQCLLLDVASDEVKDKIEKQIQTFKNTKAVSQMFYNDSLHNRSGFKVLKQWDICDKICQIVQFHNQPDRVPEEYKKLVFIVYLADVIQHYIDGEIEFYQINNSVKKSFNINSEEELKFIIKQMEGLFTL